MGLCSRALTPVAQVDSSAKAGTELGFEFKAILDNDFQGFSADDFDVEINASSIALSGYARDAVVLLRF